MWWTRQSVSAQERRSHVTLPRWLQRHYVFTQWRGRNVPSHYLGSISHKTYVPSHMRISAKPKDSPPSVRLSKSMWTNIQWELNPYHSGRSPFSLRSTGPLDHNLVNQQHKETMIIETQKWCTHIHCPIIEGGFSPTYRAKVVMSHRFPYVYT